MNKMDNLFPEFKKNIENLIEDEEGNIPGNKLMMIGTMVIILGSLLVNDVFARHRSHSSHQSHRSHVSGAHGSHGNHGSHESHESHQSHTSHSNTGSHSNSSYSAEGDVSYSAPPAYKVPGVIVNPVQTTENTFALPDVNQNIETPNSTPGSGIMPSFAVPSTSTGTKIDSAAVKQPSATDKVR